MVEIGSILRKARESKKYKLKTVSEVLKVRVRHLEAIEAGDFVEVAKEIYLTGCIRSYANWLGLDSEELLRDADFIKQNKEMSVKSIYNVEIPNTDEIDLRPSGKVVMASIVIAILAYCAWIFWDDSRTPSEQQPVIKSEVVEVEPKVTDQSSSTSTPVVTQNNSDNSTDNSDAASSAVDNGVATKANSAPNVAASSSASNSNNNSMTVSANTRSKSAVVDGERNFILLAKGDVILKINRNNDTLEKNLKAGETYFLTEEKNTSVSADLPKQIDVFGGKDQDEFLGTLDGISFYKE